MHARVRGGRVPGYVRFEDAFQGRKLCFGGIARAILGCAGGDISVLKRKGRGYKYECVSVAMPMREDDVLAITCEGLDNAMADVE